MRLPRELNTGASLPAAIRVLNALIRYCASITLRGSSTIRVSTGSGGTLAEAIIPRARPATSGSGTGTLLGHPTAAWSSGTTITLDPCDPAGVDTGEANATVYIRPDQASASITTFGGKTTNCTIPTTAIVAYALAADNKAYVIGELHAVLPLDTLPIGLGTNVLQIKIQYVLGGALSTISEWLDAYDTSPTPEGGCA